MAPLQPELLQVCDVCGEIYDANSEKEARHHAQSEHNPLLPAHKHSTIAPGWARAA